MDFVKRMCGLIRSFGVFLNEFHDFAVMCLFIYIFFRWRMETEYARLNVEMPNVMAEYDGECIFEID